MARPKRKIKMVRINLEIPWDTKDSMDRIIAMTNAASMSEVVRRSIDLYRVIIDSVNNGGSVTLGKAELAII